MKYFFSSLAGLFAVLFLSNPAWAEGGMKDKGFQLIGGVFADQFANNNGSTTTTTTNAAFHGDFGYGFGTFFVGASYFNFNQAVNNGTTTSNDFVNWYGPSVGLVLNNFRITATYVLSPDANMGTNQNLTNGTGFGGTIDYTFYVAPKVFIAPLIDYYSVTFSPSGGKNVTFTQLAPFLSIGFDF